MKTLITLLIFSFLLIGCEKDTPEEYVLCWECITIDDMNGFACGNKYYQGYTRETDTLCNYTQSEIDAYALTQSYQWEEYSGYADGCDQVLRVVHQVSTKCELVGGYID